MNWKWIVGGLAGVVVLVLLGVMSSYNGLVGLDQNAQRQWGGVEAAYQRRLDLIPNLVNTVKGAANFEKDTLTAITEARSKVGQVSSEAIGNIANDPAAFQRFEQAQAGLSSALSRLMVVAERYPELKATAAFMSLQVDLAGTENRINTERVHYNDAVQAFNAKRSSFPTVVIAGFFGNKFAEKPFFKSQAGAEKAPEVKF